MKAPRLSLALTLCLAAGPATVPTTAPATRPTMTDLVRRAVRQLASPNPDRVAEGTATLLTMNPDDVPLVEAAVADPALPAAARAKAKALLDRQRPRLAALAVQAHRTSAQWHWRERADLDAYHHGGHADRRWDAAALAGLIRYDLTNGEWLTATVRRRLNVDAVAQLTRAVDAGCDDPTVLAVRALAEETAELSPKVVAADLASAAAATLAAGDRAEPRLAVLMSSQLVFVHHRTTRPAATRPTTGPAVTDAVLVDRMVHHLRRLATRPGVPSEVVYAAAISTGRAAAVAKLDEAATYEAVRQAVEAGGADTAAAELLGDHEVARARLAAGGTDAQLVGNAARPEVGDHLSAARAAYAAAWAADPANHRVALSVLRVAALQRLDRKPIDTWFQRCVDTGPDDIAPYDAVREYLDPIHGGPPADLLAFGKTCLTNGNVIANVPLQAVRIHEQLVPRDPAGATAYWHLPTVWPDIRSAYEQELAVFPGLDRARSAYAAWACRCGQWTAAAVQFDRLGNRADPTAFGGPAQLDAARAHATAEAQRAIGD